MTKVPKEQPIVYQLRATWTQILFPLAVRILTDDYLKKPTQKHPPGVLLVDYEMKEELVKPWIAAWNHIERWRVSGWEG
ncbi:hypothetical protein HO173_001316 [Letharia columbiana]|uniref:Uncharacterized protein n=1 Tax=Letharia columbiana TaxID=112416 RepID=A0A8H6G4V2_9LECA|nr:uncharacterized protein HO173_001316 [Letharia columbiana]KAF6240644.1 hypothetical protein HO173_001316 [Letharia columbiana]